MWFTKIIAKKKIIKLTKTDEFSSVFSFRKRISGTYFAVHYQPNAGQEPRLGLVVSKKIAKLAVNRNYMRRVLRELYKNFEQSFPNFDFVIRVQKFYSHADYNKVEQEFKLLSLKLNKIALTKTVIKIE